MDMLQGEFGDRFEKDTALGEVNQLKLCVSAVKALAWFFYYIPRANLFARTSLIQPLAYNL